MTREFGGPHPLAFYSEWNGANDDQYDCANGGLEKLLKFRDETIRPWLRTSGPGQDWDDEKAGYFRAYVQRLEDVWSFINFVELKKDEENLIIGFW